MRLHNRQIKASFWNDGDILLWPRDKRMFYIGLAQLADDSGCLEDNAVTFKVSLYPSPVDIDITVEVIQAWKDELINDPDGHLIPYEVAGKRCLFMRNFHKHQKLNKPAPPSKDSVPLPAWVSWVPAADPKSRSGKYVVQEESMPGPGGVPDTSRTRPGHVRPEPEPEPEPEGEEKTPAAPAAGAPPAPAPAPVAATYPADFEEFWWEYPRKTEKRSAFKAWKARLKGGVDPAKLITAARNYGAGCRAAGTEEQFIKHAKTFLGPNRPYEEYIQPRAAPGPMGETRAGKYDHMIIG